MSGLHLNIVLQMSTWVVKCLDPFRKADCKLGRIASTEDFKHLARKVSTVNHLYTDTRYNDKIRYNNNLNVTKHSLKR